MDAAGSTEEYCAQYTSDGRLFAIQEQA
jgi:hypothetical protein